MAKRGVQHPKHSEIIHWFREVRVGGFVSISAFQTHRSVVVQNINSERISETLPLCSVPEEARSKTGVRSLPGAALQKRPMFVALAEL